MFMFQNEHTLFEESPTNSAMEGDFYRVSLRNTAEGAPSSTKLLPVDVYIPKGV